MAIKMSLCRQGDSLRIVRVNGSGAFKNRLMEMGFRRDVELRIVKYAPLKDPVEIRICDYNVSLRVEEAEKIDVEVLSGEKQLSCPA